MSVLVPAATTLTIGDIIIADDGTILVASTDPTQSNPQLAQNGDVGTGVYWKTAGNIALVRLGLQTLNVSAAGITANSVALLASTGVGTARGMKYSGDNDTGWQRSAADAQQGIAGGQTCIELAESGGAAMMALFGIAPAVRQTIVGSRGGNAALASLLTLGALNGYWIDGTSA